MTVSASKTVTIGGHDLQVHVWEPRRCHKEGCEPHRSAPPPPPRAIVVVYHGFLAHARHPTVRGACERFAKNGYWVVAADLPGHGSSPGLRGYLPYTADSVVDAGIQIANYAVSSQSDPANRSDDSKPSRTPSLRVFLVGVSMGGAIALATAHRIASSREECVTTWRDRLAGVLLLTPMLQLSVSTLERKILSGLARLVPTWRMVPSHCSCLETQYRDPQKRQECELDKYRYTSDWFRVGSASMCVELTHSLRSVFRNVTVPFLVLVADHDVTVDSQGCWDLVDQSPSKDKQMRRYDALHGILCEPSHVLEKVQRDMIDWVRERT